MIGTWTGVIDGKVKTVEESKPFGPLGGVVEAMAPVNGANIIRVCVRQEDGSLTMGKIIEESYALVHYLKNDKGYNDYDMDVRERMNFFTQQERKERQTKQKAKYQKTAQTSQPTQGGSW